MGYQFLQRLFEKHDKVGRVCWSCLGGDALLGLHVAALLCSKEQLRGFPLPQHSLQSCLPRLWELEVVRASLMACQGAVVMTLDQRTASKVWHFRGWVQVNKLVPGCSMKGDRETGRAAGLQPQTKNEHSHSCQPY